MSTLLEAAKKAERVLRGWAGEPEIEGRVHSELADAIEIEERATARTTKSKRRVLTVTESAYDTIIETLEMDSRSIAFDSDLRKQIRKALDAIREVAPKVRIDVHRGIAEVSKCPDFVEVAIVDHDNH